MKKFLVIALLAFASCAFSGNTIIAIVNKVPITLNSVQVNFQDSVSKDDQIMILNNYIDNIIQLQKATELELIPTKSDIENVLNDIAQSNNLTLIELMSFENYYSIEAEAFEKLSILNLQRFITKGLSTSEEQILKECSGKNSIKDEKQIKIAQIIISKIDSQLSDLDKKNILIKDFLNKLAIHIKKGASFEVFAKLHSQHPSYHNGGITNWLSVKGPILEMLDSLGKKEVSRVYKTDFGHAIAIKIDERFISSKLKACKERVIYDYAEMYYSDWLTNLREEANIEIYYDKLL
jgi:peptidyl-prolyl cis-trans isomerase SurA